MANIVQLKHLEHLEDEMLNYGTEGCMAATRFLHELTKMLGKDVSSAYMQTKWDGAPSVVCGTDPQSGMFFVGNKSVFNKTNPKICFSERDVDILYPDQPGLNVKLKMSYRYFSKLGIKGIIQGDLMFTKEDKKLERVNGEDLITFRPNTITYGIPVDHELGKKVSAAQIGVVFHTSYSGSTLETSTAGGGANVDAFNKVGDVAVIKNDTPMDQINMSTSSLKNFDVQVNMIEKMCKSSGKFLDELVRNSGTTGEKKFHIASYLKPFFNSEIKTGTITDAIGTWKNYGSFYKKKMEKEIDKVKNKTPKRELLYTGLTFFEDHKNDFLNMIKLYRALQGAKDIVIKELDQLETFRTFVLTDNGYKVTGPEGYVLHHQGDMIKIVNRLEFSYNNFTVSKQWK